MEIQCKSLGCSFVPLKQHLFLDPSWEKDVSFSNTFSWRNLLLDNYSYKSSKFIGMYIILLYCCPTANSKEIHLFNLCISGCHISRINFFLNLWVHKDVGKLSLSTSDSKQEGREASWLLKWWKLFLGICRYDEMYTFQMSLWMLFMSCVKSFRETVNMR